MLVDEMSAWMYHVLQLHEYVTHDELNVPTLTTENRIYTCSGNIFWWRFVPNKLSYKIYLVAWLSWPGHLKKHLLLKSLGTGCKTGNTILGPPDVSVLVACF